MGFLYYLFLYTIKEAYQNSDFDNSARMISLFQNDFASYQELADEIRFLRDLVSRRERNDKIIQEFATNKVICINQYSFETMHSHLRSANLTEVYTFFLKDNKIDVRVMKDGPESQKEVQIRTVRTLFSASSTKQTSFEPLPLTPLKSDLSTLYKLDQVLSTQSNNPQSKTFNMPEPTSINSLENSAIALPGIRTSAQISFYQQYIKREVLTATNKPNVLGTMLADPLDLITCVEFTRSFNILLIGQETSTVLCYVLNPQFLDASPMEYSKKRGLDALKRAIAADSVIKETLNEFEYTNGHSDLPDCIEFVGHTQAITSLSLQYDELYFLSSSVDTTIRFWCIRQRACLAVFKEHLNTVWTVKFAPRGYYFASGSSNMTVRVWTTDKPTSSKILMGHTMDVNVVEFAENCNFLISSSLDLTMRIWNLQTAECVRILYHGASPVKAIAASLRGGFFASGSEDGLVVIWDIATGEKKLCFESAEGGKLRGLSFAVDESFLCCCFSKEVQYYEFSELLKAREDQMVAENGHKSKDGGDKIKVESLDLFRVQGCDFVGAKFHPQNFIITVAKSQTVPEST